MRTRYHQFAPTHPPEYYEDEAMTYSEAMDALANAAYAAVRAANNEDGAPAAALRELAAEVDCLIDHGMTRAELADARRLHEGTRQAGMVG